MLKAQTVEEVVTNGLCMSCGLCESVTDGRVTMRMNEAGSLRPHDTASLAAKEQEQLLAACPGAVAMPRVQTEDNLDDIWGNYSQMRYAWANQADVRYRGATGGVLTTLGRQLLEDGTVKFILHVSADPDHPMRSISVISTTPEQVLERAGSRYGPVAPLTGFVQALDRGEPFGLIAKPCDLAAVHAFAATDPRVDQLCIARLTMVCGGQSKLKKSQALLDEFGITEDELALFRYRGYGNPGLTTIVTKTGETFQKTYQQLWEDEGSWELETRCKFCPDALGEAADVAAADVWPGGGPTGEDEGFNGIIVRSKAGEELVASAVASGALVLGEDITPEQFNDFQPHQVRKKHAVHARLAGLEEAGIAPIEASGLRLAELAENLSPEDRSRQIAGVKQRVAEGRIREALPG